MPLDSRETFSTPIRVDDLVVLVEERMTRLADTGGYRSEAARGGLHHLAAGGRRVRARLALSSALALRLDPDDAIALACAAELLHNASLVHDDLQDRDETRRDRPAVWRAFGDAAAVCTGDLLLSSAYAAIAGFGDRSALPALIAVMHARVATAIDGQCADTIASAETLEQYQAVARAKSGALLALPLELALIGTGRTDAAAMAKAAAEHFAVGYQIADDLADVRADEARDALNVVPILRVSFGSDAMRVARTIAMRHLAAAVAGAAELPNRCGDLLGTLATRLSATL